MSGANVEIARTLYPEGLDLVDVFFNPEAIEAVRPLMHDDLEAIFEARGIPMGAARMDVGSETSRPTVRGFDDFIETWREWVSAWETWVMTPTDFVEVDKDRVLIPMTVLARSKTHGVEMAIEGANLVTIRDGKVARLELYFDQSAANAAAGLSG
jgi:ketosteroid isomerase-like protein